MDEILNLLITQKDMHYKRIKSMQTRFLYETFNLCRKKKNKKVARIKLKVEKKKLKVETISVVALHTNVMGHGLVLW